MTLFLNILILFESVNLDFWSQDVFNCLKGPFTCSSCCHIGGIVWDERASSRGCA